MIIIWLPVHKRLFLVVFQLPMCTSKNLCTVAVLVKHSLLTEVYGSICRLRLHKRKQKQNLFNVSCKICFSYFDNLFTVKQKMLYSFTTWLYFFTMFITVIKARWKPLLTTVQLIGTIFTIVVTITSISAVYISTRSTMETTWKTNAALYSTSSSTSDVTSVHKIESCYWYCYKSWLTFKFIHHMS